MHKLVRKALIEASFSTGRYRLPPEYLSLIITFRCNFRCEMCSIWKKTDFSDELTDEQWLQLVEDLPETFGPRTWVEVNGGEPLIRKPLILTIVPALKRRFRSVALNSNGSLINEQTVRELEQAGLDTLKISFYSLTPEAHNALRGTPVAHARALQAIELVAQSRLQLEIGALVTRRNIRDLPSLIEKFRRYPNTTVILQPLDEDIESPESKGAGNVLLTNLWPSPEEVRSFFQWVARHPQGVKNGIRHLQAMEQYYLKPSSMLRYRCFVGQRNVVVYPNGKVAFCYKRAKFGDLRHASLRDVLASRAAVAERRSIRHCQKYCRVVGCNFSRGVKEIVQDALRTQT